MVSTGLLVSQKAESADDAGVGGEFVGVYENLWDLGKTAYLQTNNHYTRELINFLKIGLVGASKKLRF